MSLRRVTVRSDVPGDRVAPGTRPGHEDLFRRVDPIVGQPCSSCGKPICGHEALACVVYRLAPRARCLGCLAAELGTEPAGIVGDLRERMKRRSCQRAAWERASNREGPSCGWTGERAGAPETDSVRAPGTQRQGPPADRSA